MKDNFDKNILIENTTFDDTFKLYDITKKPFKLYGNCKNAQNIYSRMPESIAENLPYTPSATFRFAGRQNRPAAPSSRIRPWTPAAFSRQEVLPTNKFMPSVSFDLPENVSAICTAHCLCTSPVRAGPDQIFFI